MHQRLRDKRSLLCYGMLSVACTTATGFLASITDDKGTHPYTPFAILAGICASSAIVLLIIESARYDRIHGCAGFFNRPPMPAGVAAPLIPPAPPAVEPYIITIARNAIT